MKIVKPSTGRIRETPVGPIMGIDYCSRQSTDVDRSFIIDTLVRKAKKTGIKELTKSRQLKRLGFLVEIQYPKWFQGAKYALSNSRWPNYQYSNYHCLNKKYWKCIVSSLNPGKKFYQFYAFDIFPQISCRKLHRSKLWLYAEEMPWHTWQWALFYNLNI